MSRALQRELARAIEDGLHHLVAGLVRDGANPNALEGRDSFLVRALLLRDAKTARALLAAGASPNGAQGREPPLAAVIKALPSDSSLSFAKELLSAGANPDSLDEDGSPVLHVAIDYGESRVALALMDHGADLELRDPQGRSAIARAIEEDDELCVRELIARGADLNARDGHGRDLLAIARLEQDSYENIRCDYPALILAAQEASQLSADIAPLSGARHPNRL